MDLGAAFAQFVDIAGTSEAEELLVRMMQYQAATPEALGGDTPLMIEQKLEGLANAHGLVNPVDKLDGM